MRPSVLAAALPLVLAASVSGAQAAPPAPPTPPTSATPAAPPVPAAAPTAPTPPSAPTPPAPAVAISAADVDREAVLALGRFVATWTNMTSIDSLVSRADPGMGTVEVVRERLTTGLASFGEQLGTETKVVAERVMIVNGQVQYWRTAEYTNVPVPLIFRVVMGRNGRWRGFTVTPPDQVPSGEEVKAP